MLSANVVSACSQNATRSSSGASGCFFMSRMCSDSRLSAPASTPSLAAWLVRIVQYTPLSKHAISSLCEPSCERASALITRAHSATTRSSAMKDTSTAHSSFTKCALSISRSESSLLHIAASRPSAAAVTSASAL